MRERNEEEIANKIMKEFSKFVAKCSEEYGMGTGMLVVSTNRKNADAMIGTIFGNASTFDKRTEERLRDVAIKTLDGSIEAAKEVNAKKKKEKEKHNKDLAEQLADKVVELAENIAELARKKEKAWEIAHEEGLIVDGEVDEEELANFVKRNNGSEKDVKDFKRILEGLIEEHKED